MKNVNLHRMTIETLKHIIACSSNKGLVELVKEELNRRLVLLGIL